MGDRNVRRSATHSRGPNFQASGENELMSREEEFRLRNAEFEAKTAALVDEADSILKDQESVLNKTLLSNVNADDFFKDLEDVDDYSRVRKSKVGNKRLVASKDIPLLPPGQSHGTSLAESGDDPTNVLLKEIRRNLADQEPCRDVILDEPVEEEEGSDDEEEASLPGVPPKIVGAESRARVLQAEVRVLREENDKLGVELRRRAEENSKLVGKLKDAEEERRRLERTDAAHRSQMEKYKRLSEEAKAKSESLENQLQGVRKELDGARRATKQQTGVQNATEVRLNRALEDVQKLRNQIYEAKTSSKDSDDKSRKQVEQLLTDNKRLEKQKNDLVVGFKKQMKLIDVLKRQRMHVEAARMLQFSEEEFVKALDWGQ